MIWTGDVVQPSRDRKRILMFFGLLDAVAALLLVGAGGLIALGASSVATWAMGQLGLPGLVGQRLYGGLMLGGGGMLAWVALVSLRRGGLAGVRVYRLATAPVLLHIVLTGVYAWRSEVGIEVWFVLLLYLWGFVTANGMVVLRGISDRLMR